MSNSYLNNAKIKKDDEYYTLYKDVEKELSHYTEQLKNKIIYCNCDDYRKSNFVKYFRDNFDNLNLQKLIATHYIQQTVFDDITVYKFEKTKDDEIITELNGDGDYKSVECMNILQHSDIVITNPPFSIFKDYISLLLSFKKQFLILGNLNAVTYKEVFPYIRSNEITLGCFMGCMKFVTDENEIKNIGPVCWFTNINHHCFKKPLKLSKNYDPELYPKYDNYDAVDVQRVTDIPVDYNGIMGVPVTFLDKYNPEQFEILGAAAGNSRASGVYYDVPYIQDKNDHGGCVILKGERQYTRLFIKRK